jgi:hypothetical protein
MQEAISVPEQAQYTQVQVDLGWGNEMCFFAYWEGVVVHAR